ncbi:hypothetical protein STAQ_15650 [Allostella sp. ATCC 35155]|nr:hypothetical protein STAQ_15650 [Stella sp. ATCC 35155]
MSVNKYRDHLLILPEDDANRQLANGFLLEADTQNIQVLPEAGGWLSVCEVFLADHVGAMRKYDRRYVILLLDFDDDPQRANKVNEQIPEDLRDRVFVLGASTEPESLKRAGLGSYETIGRNLATECRSGNQVVWENELLRQNAKELDRMRNTVCEFIF